MLIRASRFTPTSMSVEIWWPLTDGEIFRLCVAPIELPRNVSPCMTQVRPTDLCFRRRSSCSWFLEGDRSVYQHKKCNQGN